MKRIDRQGLRYSTVSQGYAPFCWLCDYYYCSCWHGVVTNGRAINCQSHSVHHVEMLEFFIACISISWPAIKIDSPPTNTLTQRTPQCVGEKDRMVKKRAKKNNQKVVSLGPQSICRQKKYSEVFHFLWACLDLTTNLTTHKVISRI